MQLKTNETTTMKPSILPTQQKQARPIRRVLDRLAKRGLLATLESISQGHLTLIDNDQVFEYGNGNANQSDLKVTITVRNPAFYSAVAFGGSIEAGESYFMGDWDCDNLTDLVRLLLINRDVLDTMDSGMTNIKSTMNKGLHWLNRNSQEGSRRNISAHYDIGNDLFKLMLDKSMMYSSAIYPNDHATLEQASFHKLDLICKKLQLKDTDQLVEIGTGWGAMAIHAAKHYGCQVTTTTISQQQYDYAKQWVSEEGLGDKITLLFEDYRNLSGHYDKLVSIEMIEAVGLDNLDTYFEKCSSLLKADGMMCIQGITIADQKFEQAKKQVDFIQKYIFPGGSLPSVTAMCQSVMNKTDMHIFDLEDIGHHYARTLNDRVDCFFQTRIKGASTWVQRSIHTVMGVLSLLLRRGLYRALHKYSAFIAYKAR